MKYSPDLQKGEITATLQEQLSTGPKLAEELLGPRWILPWRITAMNRFYRRIGSHWRIVGKKKNGTIEYSMTMKL